MLIQLLSAALIRGALSQDDNMIVGQRVIIIIIKVEVNMAEMYMLSWICGLTINDRMRNDYLKMKLMISFRGEIKGSLIETVWECEKMLQNAYALTGQGYTMGQLEMDFTRTNDVSVIRHMDRLSILKHPGSQVP